MGDLGHLTPTQLSTQQKQLHRHQHHQMSESPQSELNIPTPAPRVRSDGDCSTSYGCNQSSFIDCENATYSSGVMHIDTMDTENVYFTTSHEAFLVGCAPTTPAHGSKERGRRHDILKSTTVNTICVTERFQRATCRRGIKNEENNKLEQVQCAGPVADYSFSCSFPSSEERPDIESEILHTPHVLLHELSNAAESPQITLSAQQRVRHRKQRLTSPLPDDDTDTPNTLMNVQKEQGRREHKNDSVCSLSIPSPLPCREVRTHLHTSGRIDTVMNPLSEGSGRSLTVPCLGSASIDNPNEKQQQQERERETTTILCPIYESEDIVDDYNRDVRLYSETTPCGGSFSFVRFSEQYTPPRGVCDSRATQPHQEREPKSEQRRLSRPGITTGTATSTVSPDTSVPVLVDWRVVVEESIVLDVTVGDEDEGKQLSNGESEVSQKETWCGTTHDVDVSQTPNCNDNNNSNNIKNNKNNENNYNKSNSNRKKLQQLRVSMGHYGTPSWPPPVESVRETSIEGGEGGHDDYAGSLLTGRPVGMCRLLDAIVSTATTTSGDGSRSSNDNDKTDNPRGYPTVTMPIPSSPLRGRMGRALATKREIRDTVVSPHHEGRSDSHSSHMRLAVELCRAVRPFAQRLLLLLVRESGGGACVHADACAEAINSILESEGILSMRATQNLCRLILTSTSNWGGSNDGSDNENGDANMIQYGDFMVGIVQLGDQN